MSRLFGTVGNITLATATATTGPPNGTGSVELARGGRLKSTTIASVQINQAAVRGTINCILSLSNLFVGNVLASGWIRGFTSATGGDIAEAESLHWDGDLPVPDATPSWLFFGLRNDQGNTLTFTYSYLLEYP